MDSQLEEVKKRTDIVGLINEYTPLKKAGRNYKALCPFHNEKTPSFMVSPDRQIFKCFGCSEGGDVFAFVKKSEGVEFGEALRILARRAGVKLKEYKPTRDQLQKDRFVQAHELASQLYHHLLVRHPLGKRALEYLTARGVKQKTIKDFRLGFAPNKQTVLLDFLKRKGFSIQEAISAGLVLVSANRPKDRFRGRVMFPIFDSQDRVIAFSGRALGDIEPKYLNSPETPIFSKSRALYGINLAKTDMKREKNTILVEGNFDVISSHQIGVTNVVAPLGTALTSYQIDMLKRWADNLLFAFDTDLAGDAAAKRGIEMAENSGMSIRVVHIDEGKDPDEIIRQDPLSWKRMIKTAVPIYDFFITAAVKKFGTGGAEEKRKVAAELLPIITKIGDEILRAHYLQVLSTKLGVEEAVLRRAATKYQTEDPSRIDIKEVLDKPLSDTGLVLVEKYLLALIIQGGQFPPTVSEEIFSNSPTKEIFRKALENNQKEGRIKVKSLVKKIPEALLPSFDDLLLLDVNEDVVSDGEKLTREINYCTTRLKEINLRAKLKSLSLEIKQAEAVDNQPKVSSLSEKFRDLSKVLSSLAER